MTRQLGHPARSVLLGSVAVMVLVAATVVLGVTPSTAQVVHRPLHATRGVDAAPVGVPFPIEYFGLAADLTRPTDRPAEDGPSPYGEVRFHQAGAWGAWQPLGQDGAQDQTRFTASLVSVDHADAYQVRGLPAVFHNPRATTFNLTSGPVESSRSAAGTAADASSACRSRADWNADESITAWSKGTDTPQYAPDQVLTVHHTAGSNNPNQNYANTVLATEQYHVLTNGWSDIGYQYLIDPHGVVYEGRYSGHTSSSCLTAGGDGSDFAHRASDDAVVTGAHAGGYNTGNLGIAMLGCFDSTNATCQPGTYGAGDTVPTPAAMTALEQLLAKLATRHGLNPTGTTNYTNSVTTKPGIATISGHRDWEATACPGDNVYSQLSTLRSSVRGDMKPANLQATATDTTAHLSWSPGLAWPSAPASTRYQVVRQGGPSWVTSALSFDDSGLTPATSYSYQVSALASDGTESSGSASVTVTTAGTTPPTGDFGLSLNPSSGTVTAGGGASGAIQTTQINSASPITLSAAVSPADGSVSATVNPQSLAAGSSATLELTTTVAAAGTYTVTVTGTSPTATHSVQYSLSVTNARPTATITPSGCTGAKCGFSGSGSDPEKGTITLGWAMPNANPSAAGNVPSVTTSYSSPGTFTVTLTTTDPAHLTGTATATVNCTRIGKGKTKTLSCSARVP